MVLCEVCQENEKKYKCPKCFVNYCSLACFKDHTEKGYCDKLKQPTELTEKFNSNKSSMIFLDEEQDNIVPVETLEKLGQSEDLKRVLQNPHLRDFLKHLNSTHNPKGFMKLAIQVPIFVEFSNICMKILHPEREQREEKDAEINIENVFEILQEITQSDDS